MLFKYSHTIQIIIEILRNHDFVTESHAETILAEVLEQEVWVLTLLVLCVRCRGDGGRIEKRAACSVFA